MGYCEQSDIHSPSATVLEALLFSARLRLGPEISDDRVLLFVYETLDVVGLMDIMWVWRESVSSPDVGCREVRVWGGSNDHVLLLFVEDQLYVMVLMELGGGGGERDGDLDGDGISHTLFRAPHISWPGEACTTRQQTPDNNLQHPTACTTRQQHNELQHPTACTTRQQHNELQHPTACNTRQLK
eukprot:350146-Chlamydomonas_euryale.AAC.6